MGKSRLSIGVLLLMAPLWAQLTRKAPPDVEAALKARVEKFYNLYQQGKFRQAESVVAEQSRDLYYGMQKTPIRNHQFEDISFSEDFQTAHVLVSCLSGHPRLASAGLRVPVPSTWKVINGEWYMLIEPRTTTPFGPMKWDDPRETKQEPPARATLETVTTGTFQVEPQKITFPRQGSGIVSRSIVVKNNLPGPLTLELENEIPGVTVKLPQKALPPKSQVSFEISYDPQRGKLSGTKELALRAMPLGSTATIQLQFE